MNYCAPQTELKWRPDRRFPVIINHSLSFGVYDGKYQIGYCRVITDHSEFTTIWDVFIDEAYRKKD